MKNRYYIFIVILFSLFIFVNSAKADCPEGYSSHSVTKMYSYMNGATVMQCPFTITYCCRWNPETQTVEAIIDYITLPDFMCWIFIPNWMNFFQWVNETVAGEAYKSCSPQYPPCDDPNNNNIITKVKAMQCKKFIHYLFPGDDVWITKIVNCSGYNYCKETYKICSDYSQVDENGMPITIIQFVSSEEIGVPSCSNDFPQLPPWGETWETAWETECFTNGCN